MSPASQTWAISHAHGKRRRRGLSTPRSHIGSLRLGSDGRGLRPKSERSGPSWWSLPRILMRTPRIVVSVFGLHRRGSQPHLKDRQRPHSPCHRSRPDRRPSESPHPRLRHRGSLDRVVVDRGQARPAAQRGQWFAGRGRGGPMTGRPTYGAGDPPMAPHTHLWRGSCSTSRFAAMIPAWR